MYKRQSIRDGISAAITIEANKVLAHKVSPAILMLGDQGQLGVRTVNLNNEVEFNTIEILEDTSLIIHNVTGSAPLG